MKFTQLPVTRLLERLERPSGDRRIRMVLDTDTYNEIDDQFAVTYAMLSQDRLDIEALYAAPFHNDRSSGPAEGMEKSYEEIHRVLDRLNVDKSTIPVLRGSTSFLPSLEQPVRSEAVEDLIQRAMGMPDDEPLYVLAIGAITNVASALLLEPRITDKIVIVWLGGHALHHPHTREFNLEQDVLSARVVFDSGAPVVLIPCLGVTSHLLTTLPEMERYVKGQGAIGDYLTQIFEEYTSNHFGYSKVIWDISAVAYLLLERSTQSELIHSPIVTDQVTWSVDQRRHFIRYVSTIHRDVVFKDLFTKLKEQA